MGLTQQSRLFVKMLDGITAAVVGLIALTAIRFLIVTISSPVSLVILVVGLALLVLIKSKFVVMLVIASGAMLGFAYFQA